MLRLWRLSPVRRLLRGSVDAHLKDLEVPLARSSRRLAWMLGAFLTLPLGAQEKAKDAQTALAIPVSALPPAGLCRVWLKDVPAGQQPAPTDCATAIRNRPATAQLVFGPRPDLTTAAKSQGAFGTVAPLRITDPPVRAAGAASKAFVPATPSAAAAAARSGDRQSGAHASTVSTSGPVIRTPETAVPAKAPPKPMEYPQS